MQPIANWPGRECCGLVVGKQYRVVKDGACLYWMKPWGTHGWQGCGCELPVGTVLTFHGEKWGWGSDPGVEAEFSGMVNGKVANGGFGPVRDTPDFPQPIPGYLEEV